MLDKLQAVEDKYMELESLISDPDVLSDMQKWQHYNKEHAALLPIVEKFREYKKVCQTIEDDKAMFDEPLEGRRMGTSVRSLTLLFTTH